MPLSSEGRPPAGTGGEGMRERLVLSRSHPSSSRYSFDGRASMEGNPPVGPEGRGSLPLS
jgi:hypothetical protein